MTRAAAGLAAFALASTVLATPGVRAKAVEQSPSSPQPRRLEVVVVALDGARYQDVFASVDVTLAQSQGLTGPARSGPELMPRLHALLRERGAALGAPGVGAPISASGPDFVSLPGYSEILTGNGATGCESNACQGTLVPSIADQLALLDSRPGASAVITSWPDIERVAARGDRVAISTGRHAGRTRSLLAGTPAARAALERAEPEPPWPGHGDFRRDRFTAELALTYLRETQPSFLFVSLGEPDEFAHQNNYAGYLTALAEADAFIGQVSQLLAERERGGERTALFVTADHGRAHNFRDHGKRYPESARVWLVACGSEIRARGLVAATQPRHLADIAPTLRLLFALSPDTSVSAGKPLAELLFEPQN